MNLAQITRRLIKLDLVLKLYPRKALSQFGIYFGQMPILDYIHDHEDCTQIEIAEASRVSPASIALSTKRLEKSGFITKRTDESNLRCKRLALTPKGEDARRLCKEILDSQDKKMFTGFTEEELLQFTDFVDRATINLTEEKENVVNHTVFRDLEKQIEELHVKKKEDGEDD